MERIRKITKMRLFLPIFSMLLVMAVNIIYDIASGNPPLGFFAISIKNGILYGRLIDIMNRGGEVAILAIGMTFVVSASAGTDISVGSVMSLTGGLTCMLLAGYGVTNVSEYAVPLWVGLLAGIAVACLCGLFNGFLVAYMNIQPMVATLILWSAGRAIGLLLCNSQIVYVRVESFQVFGAYVGIIPTPILIAAGCVLVAALVLKFTALGTYVQSVGINKRASRIAGFNSARIILLCFVISGLCAGIAGLVATSRIYSADTNNIGLNMELDAILAVALGGNSLGGGKFSLSGSIIGAFTIQAITTTLLALGVSTVQAPVFKAVVVILIVVIQSEPVRDYFKKLSARREAVAKGGRKSMSTSMKKLRSSISNNLLLFITIVLFIAMYLGGCIAYADKGFTHLQTFLNILINNAGLICVACGMTCVMLTGGIDISVGSLIAMDCMIMAVGIEHWGMSSPALMVMILVIGLIFGFVQGFCVSYLGIQPFIATMAGMFFARGMTAVIDSSQVSIVSDEFFVKLSNMKFELPFGSYVNSKGVEQVPYIRITVIVALLVVAVTYLMLKYVRFGRGLYAIGGNQQSAQLMGLNVRRTKLGAYIVCSFLTSIGGICYCLNTMSGTPSQATGLEMEAISSAVIGGTLLTGGVGSVIGSLFGVLINGTISSIVKTNGKLVSSWANIVTAILLCFFIVLQAVFVKMRARQK